MAGPEAVSSRDLEGLQKAPPNSIEAEEALLGSALLSRDAANRLMESVKSSDFYSCLLYTSPSPRDVRSSRMPSSA